MGFWLRRNTTLFGVLGVLQWVCFGLVAVFAGIHHLEPKGWPEWAKQVIAILKLTPWWLMPALAIVAGGLKLGRETLGPPWVWEAIQGILDDYRALVFEGCQGKPLHHFRITIFEYKRLRIFYRWQRTRWPWSGWLCLVARSMHTTQRVGAFLVPLNDPDKAEGVAGQIFVRDDEGISLPNLPLVTKDSSVLEVEDYARRTFVSSEWVQSRLDAGLPVARTLCGYPLRTADNRIWGVIVFDSVEAGCISLNGNKWKSLKPVLSNILSRLLQRI